MTDLTKRTVKHLSFRYSTEVPDLLLGGMRTARRRARRGEEVELNSVDLERGERLGAFFTDSELAELGTAVEPSEEIELPIPAQDDPHGVYELEDDDEDDDDLEDEDDEDHEDAEEEPAGPSDDLVEFARNATETQMVDAATNSKVARQLLAAEEQATGGDPRKGVKKRLTRIAESGE